MSTLSLHNMLVIIINIYLVTCAVFFLSFFSLFSFPVLWFEPRTSCMLCKYTTTEPPAASSQLKAPLLNSNGIHDLENLVPLIVAPGFECQWFSH